MAPRAVELVFTVALAVLLLPSAMAQGGTILFSPGSITTGNSLRYGNYYVTMQTDCNLVLYEGGRALWASGTQGRGSGCVARMQSDGNLVVYNGAGQAVWASNTNLGNGVYALIMQFDRNLVIYGPARWSTGTYIRAAGVPVQALNNKTLT